MVGDTPVNRKVESGDTCGMFCDTRDFRPFVYCGVFLYIYNRDKCEMCKLKCCLSCVFIV
jgi:hypothetical protein